MKFALLYGLYGGGSCRHGPWVRLDKESNGPEVHHETPEAVKPRTRR